MYTMIDIKGVKKYFESQGKKVTMIEFEKREIMTFLTGEDIITIHRENEVIVIPLKIIDVANPGSAYAISKK